MKVERAVVLCLKEDFQSSSPVMTPDAPVPGSQRKKDTLSFQTQPMSSGCSLQCCLAAMEHFSTNRPEQVS